MMVRNVLNARRARALVLCAAMAMLGTAAQAQTPSPFKQMRKDIKVQTANMNSQKSYQTMTIRQAMDYHRIEGFVIITIVGGAFERIEHFGHRNTQDNLLVDENTIFSAASMSKLPASIAVVEAARQGIGPRIGRVVGKIANQNPGSILDRWYDTRSKVYWNKRTGFTHGPGMRRLMNHTAGLSRHAVGTSVRSCETALTSVLLGNTACDQEATLPQSFPGTLFDYSGGGYTVAEAAVETVSGLSAEVVLQNMVLAPMGMTRSTYARANRAMTNLARACFDRGLVPCSDFTRFTDVKFAGGLLAHPVDYARLINVLMHDGKDRSGRQVFPLSTIEEILTPAWYKDSSLTACTSNGQCTKSGELCLTGKCRILLNWGSQRYGLGVKLSDALWNGLAREFHHGGSQPGVATQFWADRKDKKAVIMFATGEREFTNAGHPPPVRSGYPGSMEFIDDMLAAWQRAY